MISMHGLKEWKGLKFPDIYIVRFFFKYIKQQKLDIKRVLELGCGSGNNLYLFSIYGFDVQGVDISKENIENAKFNFSQILKVPKDRYNFVCGDIREKNILNSLKTPNDILLLPNVVYYLSKADFVNLLKKLRSKLAQKGLFFVRFRSPRDGRNLCRESVNGIPILKTDKTGEFETVQTFYEEYEMVDLLREFLNVSDLRVFHVYEEVETKSGKVFNSDIVIWGKFHLD